MIGDRDTAVHLYRIAQEATSNAIRHGHATVVFIRLAIDGNQVILTIQDNGIGIRSTESPTSGMGLRSMRYRAGILNGSIDIAAMPEGGTRVCCRTPLPVVANSDSLYAD